MGQRGNTEQGYAYDSLTRPGTVGHIMEPFMLIFDPNLAKGPPISHDGQEFLYVISGTIGLFYDGKEYSLEQGDSVYLDSSRSHTLYCLGDKPAQLLAVVSAQV